MTKRKPNKYFFKKNNNGSITFKSQEALSRYIKQTVERETEIYRDLMYNEVLSDIEIQTETISRDVLKRFFGFGKVRQDRFLEKYNYQIDCIRDKLVTLEDIESLNEGEIEWQRIVLNHQVIISYLD